jgi:TPP-dependent indolepyruvate ferredoxin oxidoreductase alpha subunit
MENTMAQSLSGDEAVAAAAFDAGITLGTGYPGAPSTQVLETDPLFSVAYMDAPGALVILSADDPGMASSQNEQDNRRYAAAGIPLLEVSVVRSTPTTCFLLIPVIPFSWEMQSIGETIETVA